MTDGAVAGKALGFGAASMRRAKCQKFKTQCSDKDARFKLQTRRDRAGPAYRPAMGDRATAPMTRRFKPRRAPASKRAPQRAGRVAGPGIASVGVFGRWALNLDAYFDIGF